MSLTHGVGLVRIYSNGDSSGRTVKFFLNAKVSRALGIEAGDFFRLEERLGQLELVPVEVRLSIAQSRGGA